MEELDIKVVVGKTNIKVIVNGKEKIYRTGMSAYVDLCAMLRKVLVG